MEDDLEMSPDYFNVLRQVVNFGLIGPRAPNTLCFSPINDLGLESLGPWSPSGLRKTSYFPGIGWSIYREKWASVKHYFDGGRHWDNMVRTHPGLKDEVCIVPEVSRIKHKTTRGSVHGNSGQQGHMDRLMVYFGSAVTMEPLRDLPHSTRSCPSLTTFGLPEHHWMAPRGNIGTIFHTPRYGSCLLTEREPYTGGRISWILGQSLATSCDTICSSNGKTCELRAFTSYEDFFYELSRLSSCTVISFEFGDELPAFLPDTNECIIPIQAKFYAAADSRPFGICGAKHHLTRRLCPCAD